MHFDWPLNWVLCHKQYRNDTFMCAIKVLFQKFKPIYRHRDPFRVLPCHVQYCISCNTQNSHPKLAAGLSLRLIQFRHNKSHSNHALQFPKWKISNSNSALQEIGMLRQRVVNFSLSSHKWKEQKQKISSRLEAQYWISLPINRKYSFWKPLRPSIEAYCCCV